MKNFCYTEWNCFELGKNDEKMPEVPSERHARLLYYWKQLYQKQVHVVTPKSQYWLFILFNEHILKVVDQLITIQKIYYQFL